MTWRPRKQGRTELRWQLTADFCMKEFLWINVFCFDIDAKLAIRWPPLLQQLVQLKASMLLKSTRSCTRNWELKTTTRTCVCKCRNVFKELLRPQWAQIFSSTLTLATIWTTVWLTPRIDRHILVTKCKSSNLNKHSSKISYKNSNLTSRDNSVSIFCVRCASFGGKLNDC